MAKMSLREYANAWLKDKGTTAAKAKKNAGKYKSIAAAKRAGSLYYTDKNGKVKLAVYAEDLKGPKPGSRNSSPRPKLRPGSKKLNVDQMTAAEKAEVKAANERNKVAREQKGGDTTSVRAIAASAGVNNKPKAKTKKEPTKFGPYYDTWRKSNSGGIVAYRKDMAKRGLKPRTSAGNR